MTLSSEEKVHLSEMFEMQGMKVLKRVIEAKILELGLNALQSRDQLYTAEQRGWSQALDWVYASTKKVHSEVNKLENK